MPTQSLDVLPVFVACYTLFGMLLPNVRRYREAYLSELARSTALEAEQYAFEVASQHDVLTGLPNRTGLQLVVQHRLERTGPDAEKCVLILMGLGGVRELNQTLGTTAGDELLLRTSKLLRRLRPAEGVLGRWAGTEFALFIPGGEPQSPACTTFLERLTCAREGTDPEEQGPLPAMRIGVAAIGGTGLGLNELVKRGEIAVREARDQKTSRPTFFDRSMQERLDARIRLEADLKLAADRGELYLEYQPQVDRTAKVTGVEALVRWCHPQLGFVPPSEFIPLAEESGLIASLGRWVLAEACKQMARWSSDPNLHELRVSINVSPYQMRESQFVESVLTTVQESGASPEKITLEITESAMLSDVDSTIAKMRTLQDHRITFAMDDFGTGYSSLSQLHSLPIRYLKIDRSFVSAAETGREALSVVHTIADLAKRLKLALVAEGVETLGQFEILDKAGCEFYQGFLHSRPLPPESLKRFVEERHRAWAFVEQMGDYDSAGPAFVSQDPKLADESARLAALTRYNILDSGREGAFDRITELAKQIFNVPMAAITLIDSDRQWIKASTGLDFCESDRNVSFCTHTIQSRAPLNIADTLLDDRFAEHTAVLNAPFIRSYLGAPLRTPDGYNLGALCVIDTVPRHYSTVDLERLVALAKVVMDEVELRGIAHFDSLTGAVSRRTFMLELDKAIARCKRTLRNGVVILVDVDRFKSINDQYGHAVGDVVLRSVAGAIRTNLRKTDVFGRLGGEEFGILLEERNVLDAVQLAERLRQQIERLQVHCTHPIRVTASFGLADIARDRDGDEVLEQADQALYEAKRTGRNRCVALPEEVFGGV